VNTFIADLRCVFLIAIVFVFMVPWVIYVNIRNRIRRTIETIVSVCGFLPIEKSRPGTGTLDG